MFKPGDYVVYINPKAPPLWVERQGKVAIVQPPRNGEPVDRMPNLDRTVSVQFLGENKSRFALETSLKRFDNSIEAKFAWLRHMIVGGYTSSTFPDDVMSNAQTEQHAFELWDNWLTEQVAKSQNNIG